MRFSQLYLWRGGVGFKEDNGGGRWTPWPFWEWGGFNEDNVGEIAFIAYGRDSWRSNISGIPCQDVKTHENDIVASKAYSQERKESPSEQSAGGFGTTPKCSYQGSDYQNRVSNKNHSRKDRWRARGDESPGRFPRLLNRCQPRINEGHVGCRSRKRWRQIQ